jgi:hypothetical protein
VAGRSLAQSYHRGDDHSRQGGRREVCRQLAKARETFRGLCGRQSAGLACQRQAAEMKGNRTQSVDRSLRRVIRPLRHEDAGRSPV